MFGETVMNTLKRLVEIATSLVDLVDETDPRHTVLVSLAPDSLALRLDAHLAVKDRDGTVEHAKTALHLGGKVDVAWCIDDVDLVIFSKTRHGRTSDRDTALTLLLHPVSCRVTFVNFTDFVRDTGAIEDAPVVVVLPASICAIIPTLRYCLSGTSFA